MSCKDASRCTRFAMILLAMISSVVSNVRGNDVFESALFPPTTSTSIAPTTATRTPLPLTPPTTPVSSTAATIENGECPRPPEDMKWKLTGQFVRKMENYLDLYDDILQEMTIKPVAISNDGTRAMMGSTGDYHGKEDIVDVFKYNGINWTKEVSFSGPDRDTFGRSISLSGDGKTIAVDGWSQQRSGYVEVYHQTEDGTWKQKGSRLVGLYAFEGFGAYNGYDAFSLSLSENGNRLAVGIPYSGLNDSDSGSITVYEFNENDWTQLGDKIAGEAGFRFGYAVSLSADGNVVAGGAPESKPDEYGYSVGSVRVFRYNNERRATTNIDPLRNMKTTQKGGQWVSIGQTLIGEDESDQFGYSLSINANGNIIAIGTSRYLAVEGWYVKVFHLENEKWKQIGNTITGWMIGLSLAAKTLRLAVGYNDVRVYDFDGQNWKRIGHIESLYDETDFGTSVSLSSCGDRVAINFIYNDDTKTQGGMKIYEFK